MKPKLLIITGPTATGKSALGIELAKAFSGEIISADSRQVYRGLDIGSAKIAQDEMQGIPHFLLDVADPKDIFNVSDFQKRAKEKIAEIAGRGNLPILVGGTGMYISSVIDGLNFPEVPPNESLRKELESLSAGELFERLEELDPDRALSIDKNNPVRLVRAIEIANALGSVPKIESKDSLYETLIIGLELPKEELVSRIQQRIDDRIPALFDEVKKLLREGVSPDRLNAFGLEYRYGLDFVLGKITLQEFKEMLAMRTWQYVRRQITWWKRDSRVIWMNPIFDHQKILQLVQEFLKD
ncbi:MAG: miaA [Patescibacteria group bacterium]|nr:miaA [Patescibacteria group bacterium]